MARTVVSICNNALLQLGAARIASLTENSNVAKLCNQRYEPVRDQVTRARRWKCSLKRASLAQLVTAPAYEFTYAYALPADCLKVWQMEETYMVYTIESGALLTNETVARILYGAIITDPNLFDAYLAEAISGAMAADMAYAITGSETKAKGMLERSQQQLRDAAMSDGQEGSILQMESGTLIDVRNE